MAEGARPTLKLKPPAAKPAPPPAEVPLYDPNKCAQLVGGVGLVQGKNVFHEHGGHGFIREAPKEYWYFLTPEQEANYARQMAKQRQTWGRKTPTPPASVPAKVIEVARENAQALAAESHAE